MAGQRLGFVLIPTLIVCTLITLLTATAKFSYRHPNAMGQRFSVTRDGVVLKHNDSSSEPNAAAMVDAIEYDFGHMNPLTMGTHAFVIRNEGDAPLKLQPGPTTCKCTLSHVFEDPIPPGGEGRVTVQWNTGRNHRFYAHEASVYTNDPFRKRLNFSVRGIVRMQLTTDPPQAIFDRIEPDTSATKKLLVYSQIWDDFEIADVWSSLPGMSWKITSADQETRMANDACSAFWLHVTTPDNLPEGRFSEWLHFTAQPADESDESIEYQVQVAGKTLKRLAVYGAGIDSAGVVSLGAVPRKVGTKKRLLLKVRDPQRQLPVKRIVATPDFLDVRVSPDKDTASNGLLYLDITIPPGSPVANYLSTTAATIRIEFDHPRITELELTSRFAVTE